MCVIGIVVVVAALTYPVFVSAKKSSKRSVCFSNLRQIGTAVAIYRSEYDGAEQGTPSEMGLPPDFSRTGRGAATQAAMSRRQTGPGRLLFQLS
jgi:hypothetical protein